MGEDRRVGPHGPVNQGEGRSAGAVPTAMVVPGVHALKSYPHPATHLEVVAKLLDSWILDSRKGNVPNSHRDGGPKLDQEPRAGNL